VNVEQSSSIERLRVTKIVGFRFDDRTRRINVDNVSENVQLFFGNHDRSLKSKARQCIPLTVLSIFVKFCKCSSSTKVQSSIRFTFVLQNLNRTETCKTETTDRKIVLNCVATHVFSMRFMHEVAFLKYLPWFAQTSVITLKTQMHAVNARRKRLSQLSFTENC